MRARLALAVWVVSTIALLSCDASVAAEPTRASLALGAGFPFLMDDEVRSTLDSRPIVTLTGTIALDRTGDVALVVGTEWRSGVGPEFVSDPTFELDDARYDLWIGNFGLRRNLATGENARPGVSLWGGMAFQVVHARWRDALDETSSTTVAGLALEIMPQFSVSRSWSVWGRFRTNWVQTVALDGAADFDVSAFLLDAGVTRVFH